VEKIITFIKEFGIFILIGFIGLAIVGYGLWGEMYSEKSSVEIVKGDKSAELGGQIIVDVAGAVEKPGVYKLSSGSRIGDVLVLAGGLSASADRDWVAKTINLAEEVKDGGKIFIPAINSRETQGSTSTEIKININTASISELDSLTGIGETRAKLIMDNRPYSKIDDLVSKSIIPESVYEKIKNNITVY